MSAPFPERLSPVQALTASFQDRRPADDFHPRGTEQEVLRHFDELRSRLTGYLWTLGVRDQDAEEVIQEVFLALFQHLRLGRARTNLRGWIFRVAHNLGLKRRSASRRTDVRDAATLLDLRADPGPDPEQQARSRQRSEKLTAVFEALPERDRCCLQLRAEGLRYRDIAKTLGVSLGSVAQSLARSLERMERADERL